MESRYGFGRKRLVKPARKWKTPTPQVDKQKQSSVKPNTAGHSQNRTTQGIFIFGSLKQGATKTKSSLPAVQDSPGHQDAPGEA